MNWHSLSKLWGVALMVLGVGKVDFNGSLRLGSLMIVPVSQVLA